MIIAHYLEGRGHGEIAADFGLSKQAVSRRIANGVDSVRRTLARARKRFLHRLFGLGTVAE